MMVLLSHEVLVLKKMDCPLLHRNLWEGFVPFLFQLPCSEMSSVNAEEPLTVHKLLPRMSYLVSHVRFIVEYFQMYSIEFSSIDGCVYFVVDKTVLPSYFPIGALFDLFDEKNLSCLHVEVFFRTPPFLECRTTEPTLSLKVDMERTFFHNLKQGLQIVFGTNRKFGELSVEQQIELWKSTENGSYLRFSAISHQLLPASVTPRAIPVRILFRNGTAQQKSIKVEKNQPNSLKDVIENEFHLNWHDIDIMVQGISINPHISIADLWMQMRHPDTFLYISISHISK